jgi:hypothetical protein
VAGGVTVAHLKTQVSNPGWLWAVAKSVDAGGVYNWLISSPDRGESWTVHVHTLPLYMSCPYHAGMFSEYTNITNIIPSPHDPTKVHVFGACQYGSALQHPCYWRAEKAASGLYEIGPSWLWVTGRWRQPRQPTNNTQPCGGHVPYRANAAEGRIYVTNHFEAGAYKLIRWDYGGWIPNNPQYCLSGTGSEVVWEWGTDITPTFAQPTNDPKLFGSFTEDKDYIWFVCPLTHEVGLSLDAGATWTQKTDAPFDVACASGYPSDNALFFLGRTASAYLPDSDMLYVSLDAGATWTDKTGDLYTVADAFESITPANKAGICNIVPKW